MNDLVKIKKRSFINQKISFWMASLLLTFSYSCTIKKSEKNESSVFHLEPKSGIQPIKIEPVDASVLELEPYAYINWLKSNKGLTYNDFENDSVSIGMIYQPVQLQAAIGMANSGLSYEQLLKSKEGFHYFMIEFLFKNRSPIKNDQGTFYLKKLQENLFVIKNQQDTLDNIMIESFKSPIMGKPDQLLVLVPDNNKIESISCSISKNAFGINDLKITIPAKQFELFPTLKI